MDSAFEILKETPVSNLLIAVGAVMLILSIVGRFGTYIEVPAARQGIAGVLGAVCMAAGLAISFLPRDEPVPAPGLPSTPPAEAAGPSPAPPDPVPAGSAQSRPGFEAQVAAARAGCFVSLGSFGSRANAERKLGEVRDQGVMAEIIATSDYPWMTQGLFKVVIGAPDTAAAEAMEGPAREVVSEAFFEKTCPR